MKIELLTISTASSQQEDDEDDQKDRAEAASDVRAAEVKATPAEQYQQDDDKDYQIHGHTFRRLLRPERSAALTPTGR